MFSDTHFHFKLMAEESGHNAVEVLNTMAERNCFFGCFTSGQINRPNDFFKLF